MSLDDKNAEIIAKIIKDRDHVFAKYKVIKKEKAEFVVANARLLEDMEKLDKAHKALESTHSLLVKSHVWRSLVAKPIRSELLKMLSPTERITTKKSTFQSTSWKLSLRQHRTSVSKLKI